MKCALVWYLFGEVVYVKFKFPIFPLHLHHLLERLTHFFLLNCPFVKHLKKLERGDSVTDSKFQLQDCSHSLVSAKPSNIIRNLPFRYCAINCAGGEVIKFSSGIVPSFICTSSDLNIWPGGSERSPEVVSI